MDADSTIPTWGYQPDGSAKIFDLARGEDLPEGWNASPTCIADPLLATAEALTDRAAGREYRAAAVIVPASTAAPIAEFEALVAENERLKAIIETGSAENTDLVAQIEGAERALDAAATEVSTLRAALASSGDEKAAALASVESLTAELAKAKADLDEVLAAPAEKPAAKGK